MVAAAAGNVSSTYTLYLVLNVQLAHKQMLRSWPTNKKRKAVFYLAEMTDLYQGRGGVEGRRVKRKYGEAEFQEKGTQKTTLPPVPNFNWKMIKANQGHVISMCNLCFVKNKILKWTYALLREPAQPFNCNSQTCCELVPGCQIEPQPRFIVDL